MQLTSLSWMPYRPCLLLRLPSACILLDCAVDLSPLSSFVPFSYTGSHSFSNTKTSSTKLQLPYLKKEGDKVFVDGPFEVHPVSLLSVAVDSIDAIIVSNWMSLFALPFFTENTAFQGTIYATDPTVQIGKLIMEEYLTYIELVRRDAIDDRWKNPQMFGSFSDLPSSDPRAWVQFYHRKQMENSLSKIKRISFRQRVDIDGTATIAAYSSGYSIGSCNWVIQTENEKIAYLSATSSRMSHTKAVSWDQLRGADALILTSLCRFPEHKPEASVCSLFGVVIDTLKKNGSVLIPISPAGVLYDLLECISMQMDQNGVAVDTPIYFISPVADSALAYSNIYVEWLSDKKQKMVYLPEEPFAHGNMVRSGRLKVYSNIHGDFCREMRTPCVLFTGHPSLRIGDAVHFLEMWGNDSRNAVIMTDPDYPLQDVYGPYEGLPIRAFFYPIETRLDYTQVNPAILPDLQPHLLLMPEEYLLPPPTAPQRIDFVVTHNPHTTFKRGEMLTIPSIAKRKRVRLHPEMLRSIDFRRTSEQTDVGLSSLRCYLSAYDNVLQLMPITEVAKITEGPVEPIRSKAVGKLDPEELRRMIAKKNADVKLLTTDNGFLLKVDALLAEIRISQDGSKSIISCHSKETRKKLAEVVSSCLQSL